MLNIKAQYLEEQARRDRNNKKIKKAVSYFDMSGSGIIQRRCFLVNQKHLKKIKERGYEL